MVSIHIVPVIVCLIIKVISSTFRFKREANTCCSLHSVRPSHCPICRNEQREASRRYVYTTPCELVIRVVTTNITKEYENIPMRHSPLLCF